MINTKKHNIADITGIASSSICLVHCIATPLLINFGASLLTHPYFNYLFISISFFSVFKATEFATNNKIVTLLWISFFCFLFSSFFEDSYHWLEYSMYLFAVLIVIGHILNIRYCRKCKNCTEEKDKFN